jgi:hypothetical protein
MSKPITKKKAGVQANANIEFLNPGGLPIPDPRGESFGRT